MQPPPPLNYLEIYYQDFVYAALTSKEGMTEVNTAGTSGDTVCGNEEMDFQEELSTASTNVLSRDRNAYFRVPKFPCYSAKCTTSDCAVIRFH